MHDCANTYNESMRTKYLVAMQTKCNLVFLIIPSPTVLIFATVISSPLVIVRSMFCTVSLNLSRWYTCMPSSCVQHLCPWVQAVILLLQMYRLCCQTIVYCYYSIEIFTESKSVKSFSKNKIRMGYFDPINKYFDNRNEYLPG